MYSTAPADWATEILRYKYIRRFLARRPNPALTNKEKKVEFAFPADHRLTTNENEKIDKYMDLARELKYCGI